MIFQTRRYFHSLNHILAENPFKPPVPNIFWFSLFISTFKYHLLNIKCDINQQDLKRIECLVCQPGASWGAVIFYTFSYPPPPSSILSSYVILTYSSYIGSFPSNISEHLIAILAPKRALKQPQQHHGTRQGSLTHETQH